MTKTKSSKAKSPSKKKSKVPALIHLCDEPLICPYCIAEVVPADVAEADHEVINLCKHVVLEHVWYENEIEYIDKELKPWWNSVEERREELKESDEAPETIYRTCPFIDYLVEYDMGDDFTVSFGFRAP